MINVYILTQIIGIGVFILLGWLTIYVKSLALFLPVIKRMVTSGDDSLCSFCGMVSAKALRKRLASVVQVKKRKVMLQDE